MSDSPQFLEVPSDLAWRGSGCWPPTGGVPIEGVDLSLRALEPHWNAWLHVAREHLYWEVPSKGMTRGFRTGLVYWADIMEWRLLTTNVRGIPGIFRQIAEREPERALSILQHGVCFSRSFTLGTPNRISLSVESVEVLLSHRDGRVREEAIRLMGTGKGIRAGSET